MVDPWRVTSLKNIDSPSPSSYWKAITAQLVVGFQAALPHSCWDVVCLDFVQVVCMLAQLLWSPVCNRPIINDFGSSLTHCFPNFKAQRVTWKLSRYTVGFISDSKSVAPVGSKRVHFFLAVFQMGLYSEFLWLYSEFCHHGSQILTFGYNTTS